MNNYTSLSRLINELNRMLSITSDTERENLIQSYYNQGLISYRQYYLLRSSVVRHEYIHDYLYTVNKHNFKDLGLKIL